MISYNQIGTKGRHGNQMFQYASTLGIARKLGVDACCNLSSECCSLSHCFTLGSVMDSVSDASLVYNEEGFSFDESVFTLDVKENVNLNGYFQSEKYFKHIEDEVRDNFRFNAEVQANAANLFDRLQIEPDNTCSIHIRRGDYVGIQEYHPLQSIEYYMNGLEILDPSGDKNVLIVSDDLDWCMENFEDNKRFRFLSTHPFVDMCMMSMCSSHVIANSSFSWWAAWLSGNKTVAPKLWFGSNGHDNWKDIYVEEWTII